MGIIYSCDYCGKREKMTEDFTQNDHQKAQLCSGVQDSVQIIEQDSSPDQVIELSEERTEYNTQSDILLVMSDPQTSINALSYSQPDAIINLTDQQTENNTYSQKLNSSATLYCVSEEGKDHTNKVIGSQQEPSQPPSRCSKQKELVLKAKKRNVSYTSGGSQSEENQWVVNVSSSSSKNGQLVGSHLSKDQPPNTNIQKKMTPQKQDKDKDSDQSAGSHRSNHNKSLNCSVLSLSALGAPMLDPTFSKVLSSTKKTAQPKTKPSFEDRNMPKRPRRPQNKALNIGQNNLNQSFSYFNLTPRQTQLKPLMESPSLHSSDISRAAKTSSRYLNNPLRFSGPSLHRVSAITQQNQLRNSAEKIYGQRQSHGQLEIRDLVFPPQQRDHLNTERASTKQKVQDDEPPMSRFSLLDPENYQSI